MSLLRTCAAVGLLSITCLTSFSGEISKILKKHSVWTEEGISWAHEQGDTDPNQTFAATRILYFGAEGKFGLFQGIVIRNRKSKGLSEGDGEAVYAGDWKEDNSTVLVSYRLVSWYKMMLPAGQKPPEIPGPVKHAVIRIEKTARWRMEFEGKTFEIGSRFKTSELRSHLELHERHPLGN